jgi:hypothetical protein
MIGYVLFGAAMIRMGTLPRWSGVLLALASGPFVGFRDSSAGIDRRVANRDLRQRQSRRRSRLGWLSDVA